MKTLVYSALARQDLADIWLAVASGNGVKRADAILTQIATRADMLAIHPELGPARPEITAGARALLCERWLILYRIDKVTIRIIRIVDGARDLRQISLAEPAG